MPIDLPHKCRYDYDDRIHGHHVRCDLQFLLGYLPDYRALVVECERADGSIAVTPYVHNPRWPVHAESWHAGRPPIFGCLDDDAGPCFSIPPDSYTSYGCYPIVYMPHGNVHQCDGGYVLCGDCAGKARDLAAYEALLNDERTADRESLAVVMWQGPGTKLPSRALVGEVFYEGGPEECGGCGKEIESAYGDPDAPKDAEDCHDDE